MNIIGESTNGYVVTVSKDEMANLVGFFSSYDDAFREVKAGSTLPISDVYKDARAILSAHKEAAEAAKKLRAAGDKFASFFERAEMKGAK